MESVAGRVGEPCSDADLDHRGSCLDPLCQGGGVHRGTPQALKGADAMPTPNPLYATDLDLCRRLLADLARAAIPFALGGPTSDEDRRRLQEELDRVWPSGAWLEHQGGRGQG